MCREEEKFSEFEIFNMNKSNKKSKKRNANNLTEEAAALVEILGDDEQYSKVGLYNIINKNYVFIN